MIAVPGPFTPSVVHMTTDAMPSFIHDDEPSVRFKTAEL
jgi:hypothetical protein